MKRIRDFTEELTAYVDGVRDGSIVASRMVRFAVDRHLDDVERSQIDEFPFWFDMNQANIVLTVMSLLTVPDGVYARKPMEPFDFQVFILAMIYGWREKRVVEVNGIDYTHRRFKEAFISMARGNTKTPLSAVISIQQLAFDQPYYPGAECFFSATKREQAAKPFLFAGQLIGGSDVLSDILEVFKNSIVFESQFSFLKTLASEGKSADSTTTQSLIRDELHAWTAKDREYYAKLATSLGKRPQSLAVTITTAGNDHSVIWIEDDAYARRVVDPSIDFDDDRLFVFIAEIDECEVEAENADQPFQSDDMFDESVWPKANPALRYGVVQIDHLRREAKKAKENKGQLADFKRFHLNRRSSSKFKTFSPEQWAIGHGVKFHVDRNTPTVVGLDIGWKDDLAGLSLLGVTGAIEVPVFDDDGEPVMNEETGKQAIDIRKTYDLQAECWIPSQGPRNLLRNPWPAWLAAGLVHKCPGEEVRISAIKHRFKEIVKERRVVALYADPYSCREFLQWAEEEFGIRVMEFNQSTRSYHEPMKEFISAAKDGRLAHSNPLLDWCASNLIGKKNAAGYQMPSKVDSKDKIDPMCASIMAFAGGMYEKVKPKRSVYKSRGFLLAGANGIEMVD